MAQRSEACAGVDVGGTFTDVVVWAEGHRPRAVKVPTTPDNQAEGVVRGIAASWSGRLRLLPHGSTTAINAILQRELARTVFVTTEGFADLLELARGDRPALYDRAQVRPEPLVPSELTVTVRERTDHRGDPVIALTEQEVDRVVRRVERLAPESIAVCLLFSYAGEQHEQRLCAGLRRIGVPITRSSALLPEFREYERASTSVLNAAIEPVMRRYLADLVRRLPEPTITVMNSGGGTAGVEFAAAAPVHTLLSGPSAGVVAAAEAAASAGFADAIAFDMGGTSTDVCLIRQGHPEIVTHAEIAGLPSHTPAVGMHTVGAGGGSIAWVDSGAALRVGPRSAGADPGPACYGNGGTEATVTDAHCALGHLDPDRTLSGGQRWDRDAANAVIEALPRSSGGAHGILSVVRATMARALRRVSTERGVDPERLALVAYGGAGPLHATELARELGARAVVVPPAPGVLSALGLLLAPARYEASRTVLADAEDDLCAVWGELAAECRAQLREQGVSDSPELHRVVDARYRGQAHELRLDLEADADLAEQLHQAHQRSYGYAVREERVLVVTMRVVARGAPVLPSAPTDWNQGEASPPRRRTVGLGGRWVECEVISRAALTEGDALTGPTLIEQPDSTTMLTDGDRAVVDAEGNLVVRIDG